MRALVMAVLVAASGCDVVYDLSRPPSDTRRTLVITQGNDETLVDFPVSIVIDYPDLDARANEDGSDIRFETPDGEPLPFELVSFEKGHLEAWVRVTLARRTEIVMVYGGASVVPDPTAAWSDLFSAVWHLEGGDREEKDSTRSDNDIAPPGEVQVPAHTEMGRIGGARVYADAMLDEFKSALCGTTAHLLVPTGSFALSMWLRPGPAIDRWSMPFEAGGYTDNVGGIAVELDTTQWNTILTGNNGAHFEIPMAQAEFGVWTYFTVVIDRSIDFSLKLYVNGASVGEQRFNFSAIASMMPTCLGGGNGYAGILDEVRIYDGLVSPAWIDAEYDNVVDRNSFVRVVEPDE